MASFKGARLDRALCNPDYIPKVNSDHSPILMKLRNVVRQPMKPHFKFQATWLSHPGLTTEVKDHWCTNLPLQENIPVVTATLDTWNKVHFGKNFARKRGLWARLAGVQKHLSSWRSSNLIKLERKLQKELDSFLDQEELLWFQKSREDWITSGDRNTRFYHATTLARRSNSIIETLKNTMGEIQRLLKE